MEDTNSSFETGGEDSSADPPAEIRPLILLLAGDAEAGDADETDSMSSSSSSQQQQSSSANLEEEMGRAVDALQRREEARVELSSGLGVEAGRFGLIYWRAFWPFVSCTWLITYWL
jgi:hypothetical protein